MNEHILPPAADAHYGARHLIKRLLTEQGLVHWRKYLIAFALDGNCRRLHGAHRLSHRQRGQRGLHQPQYDGHLRVGRRHGRAVHDQRARHLRPDRDAVAHRQPHRRRQPARGFCQAAQRGARFFFRPAFHGIHRQTDDRRSSRDAGHQPADHFGWPRLILADWAGHRHGGARSGDVVLQLRGGATGLIRAAQDDPPNLCHRAQPVPRQHPRRRDAAGNAARHPHRQSLHARGHCAGALRPQRRSGRARGQQYGARLQPRQSLDGDAWRLRRRDRAGLCRLPRARERRHGRAVLLLHHRLSARL